MSRTRLQLLHGRDEPLREPRHLRAGALSVLLDGPDLRYIRLGRLELLRRLYVAVRDDGWGTVPGSISELEVEDGGDSFAVRFRSHHRARMIDFSWVGTIAGSADGTISYGMEGLALADCRYGRIGLCLLHPGRESAGKHYEARTPAGPHHGHLPELIGPQRIEDGQILALFPAFDALSIEVAAGTRAYFSFEGDLFELEDQRNWTDASFKTYSTPLALPFPHVVEAGASIRQRVELAVAGELEEEGGGEEEAPPRVTLGPSLGRSLPPLGLGMPSHAEPLSPREAELLRLLRPDHLRVDLHLADASSAQELARANRAGEELGSALELALFVGENAQAELSGFAAAMAGVDVRVARVLVFDERLPVTPAALVRLAKARLGETFPGVPFAGGTNAYFADLNRAGLDPDGLDAVAWSINPQVHASDETSLVETLEAQGDTVRSARAFSGGLSLVVSPVTLRPRFNPFAGSPEPEPPADELPVQVDPRQASLFGAAWTLGSVKYLAEAGVDSVTLFETTGWRGVMEREGGSPLLDRFPSKAGEVFPLFHVLADLAELRGAELLEARSSRPLAADAVAFAGAGGPSVLLASTSPSAQTVVVGPLEARRVSLRVLDESTAELALAEPDRFRSGSETVEVEAGELRLRLRPYAVALVRPA